MKLARLVALAPPFGRSGGGPPPGPTLYDGPTVLHALQAWWADQAAVHELLAPGPFGGGTPRLWHAEAHADQAPPFVVVFTAAEPDGDRTTAWGTHDTLLQVNVHAETDERAAAIRKAFRRAILAAPLAVDGLPVRHVLPGAQMLLRGEGFLRPNRDSWIASLEVSIPHETDY